MNTGTHPRVTRGDSVPPTPPMTAKVVGIPTMEVNVFSIDKLLKLERHISYIYSNDFFTLLYLLFCILLSGIIQFSDS